MKLNIVMVFLRNLLLLVFWSATVASPLHDTARCARYFEDYSGDDDNLFPNEEGLPRQRPRPRVLFNDYLLEVYKVAQLVKETNCSDDLTIVNQTVSEHFCKSNKTVYSLLNGTHLHIGRARVRSCN